MAGTQAGELLIRVTRQFPELMHSMTTPGTGRGTY
jgi:hypothetical protein